MRIDTQKLEQLKKSDEYIRVFYPDERKLTQREALNSMMILISYAIRRKTVTYGELAKQLHADKACRKMGDVAGNVGFLLQKMNETILKDIPAPPLSSLLVNKNRKAPSKGVDQFMSKDYLSGNIKEKKKYLDTCVYPELARYDWNSLLMILGLPEIKYDILASPILSLKDQLPTEHKYGKNGEGKQHKALKEYIHNHPECVNIKGKFSNSQKAMEQVLPSGDRLDVYFENETMITAVEIKPLGTDDDDINRGVFQCKKYMAVLEANNLALYIDKPIRIILAIGGSMPTKQQKLCELLNVEYIDNLGNVSNG